MAASIVQTQGPEGALRASVLAQFPRQPAHRRLRPYCPRQPWQAAALNGSLDESANIWLGTSLKSMVWLGQGQPQPPAAGLVPPPHLGGQAVFGRLP